MSLDLVDVGRVHWGGECTESDKLGVWWGDGVRVEPGQVKHKFQLIDFCRVKMGVVRVRYSRTSEGPPCLE